MPSYNYQALGANGQQLSGVVEGDNERSARVQLRQQGLKPLQLRASKAPPATASHSDTSSVGLAEKLWKRRVSIADLALLTRQLAVLLQAGLPLTETLSAAAKQSRKPQLTGILLSVHSRVTEGRALHQALSEHPQAFSQLYCAMVRAGEQSGHLGLVLEQLADHTETRQQAQQRISSAMVYPIILVGVAIAVIAALMTFVVPKLVTIFETTAGTLPPLTVALIATSGFLQARWLHLLAGLALLIVLARLALQDKGRRCRAHRAILALPLVGELTRNMETARFASTLGILTRSGVPLLEALRIAREVFANLVLREAADNIIDSVAEGGSLHRAMDDSDVFPPMMVQMVASGENSGELDNMLDRAASSQERELEAMLGTLMTAFQPLLVLFMAGMVLTIVMAILLPIFAINDLVQ